MDSRACCNSGDYRVSVLSARPKVGKSTFARYLSTIVASGGTLCGRTVQKGKILYIGLEDHPGQLDTQFKNTCPPEYQENIRFLIEAPTSSEHLIDGISEQLKTKEFALVVIDTLVQSTRLDDWNDYGKTSWAINRFRKIANEFNCHVLLVHHNGKSRELNGEQSLIGSTGISASVDTVLLMNPRPGSESTILYSDRMRYGRKLEQQELCLDPASGKLRLGASGNALQDDNCESKILALLSEHGKPMEREDIRKALGIKTELLLAALKRLTDQARLSVDGEGLRGSPRRYSVRSE